MPGSTLPPDQGRALGRTIERVERLERITTAVPPRDLTALAANLEFLEATQSTTGNNGLVATGSAWTSSATRGSSPPTIVASSKQIQFNVAGIYTVTVTVTVSSGTVLAGQAFISRAGIGVVVSAVGRADTNNDAWAATLALTDYFAVGDAILVPYSSLSGSYSESATIFVQRIV